MVPKWVNTQNKEPNPDIKSFKKSINMEFLQYLLTTNINANMQMQFASYFTFYAIFVMKYCNNINA